VNANVDAKHNAVNGAEYEVVYADLLRFFPELVRELNGNPAALMRQVGLQPGVLAREQSSVSLRVWVRLLELAAVELQCPDFGMRLARRQGGGRVFGAVGVVMKNSHTLGDAITYVATHVPAHSLAAAIRLIRDPVDRSVFVAHEFLVERLPSMRQALEQILLLGHLNAVEITGGHARVREVRFRHQPLSSRATYRAYFGCPVRFEARDDGVVYSERDLRMPIVAPNEQLYASVTSDIERRLSRVTQPLHIQVRALVVRLIESRDCSIERICEELQIHPRTLHRRLKVEGKSFEGIKDDVRRDVALRYLRETDYPLSVIAEKIGYAEQSVLTRSCVRWFSACPRELRARAVD
jgi:AraC-like DNA-binding protein